MIKLIQSAKLKIPIVYLIETYGDLKELPIGIPFIRGSIADYSKYVRMMEWEVLWKGCKESGLPFNWEKVLRKNGYTDLYKSGITNGGSGLSKVIEGEEPGELEDFDDDLDVDLEDYLELDSSESYGGYLEDISYKVDIDTLRSLKLLPVWLDDIEVAVKENITNTIVYNPSLYTKKLDLPLGGIEYFPSSKNLIIIDISGSIPISVSKTILALAKTLSEQFYADVVITGSKSTLYEYDSIDSLNINTIYTDNGKDNDQVYFRKLLEEPRKYKTAIVFGDNDEPGYAWSNQFNEDSKRISDSDGKKLCKWEIKDVMSFHTKSKTELAGYARWFNVSGKITYMDKWVNDLN